MRPRTPNRSGRHLARRALLNGLLVGGFAGGVPLAPAQGAADAPAPGSATMMAADVERIAAVVYGISLPAGDAETIATVAHGVFANLHYLTLLKSEDVQLPFGYAVLVDEARRP